MLTNARVGVVGRRLVVDGQQDAGDRQDDEQHEGDAAEAVDVVGGMGRHDAVVLVLQSVTEAQAAAPARRSRANADGGCCGARSDVVGGAVTCALLNSPLYHPG